MLQTKPPEAFDVERVYDEQIYPLMAQIIGICKQHQIPVFASFAYGRDANNLDDTKLVTTNLEYPGRTPQVFTDAYRVVYKGYQATPSFTAAVTITK